MKITTLPPKTKAWAMSWFERAKRESQKPELTEEEYFDIIYENVESYKQLYEDIEEFVNIVKATNLEEIREELMPYILGGNIEE